MRKVTIDTFLVGWICAIMWVEDKVKGTNGSVTTDSNGNRTAELRYKPWGENRYTYGTTPTTYRCTGQRLESQPGGTDGLYYYGARWYDSALGRFVQPDTIIPEQQQGVQAWDRYAYVNNSPVKYNDPSGHMIADGSRTEGDGVLRKKPTSTTTPTATPSSTLNPTQSVLLTQLAVPFDPNKLYMIQTPGPTTTPAPKFEAQKPTQLWILLILLKFLMVSVD